VVQLFRRFVHHTVQELGDLVRLWCTVNRRTSMPPQVTSSGACTRTQVGASLLWRSALPAPGYAAAYRVIHALDGQAQVGLVKHPHPLSLPVKAQESWRGPWTISG
jgi:beta-glucosidase/6-phospho-beta-glucosidase/beta-galactosidase